MNFRTVREYFTRNVHKGPASTAVKAFEELSAKELKQIKAAFKKAQANYYKDFEKKIQGMTSKELDRYKRQLQSLNEDDDD